MSLISDWAVNTARGVGSLFSKYYNNVARPIGRGISTAALLTDKDNPEFKDGFQLSDIKSTYDKYSNEITPGQALIGGSVLSDVAFAPQRLASKITGRGPTVFQGDFDLYNADQRKKAFHDEWTGWLLSGATDAAVTWYADPLSKVGKVISVANKGGKVFGKTYEGLLNPQLSGNTDFATKAYDEFFKFAVKDTTDATALLKHHTVKYSSNQELLSAVLGDIKVSKYNTPELIAKYGSAEEAALEVARTFMKAAVGDKKSVEKLWNSSQSAHYAAQIERAQNKLLHQDKWVQEATKKHGGDVNAWLNSIEGTETYGKIVKELDALKANDVELQKLLDTQQTILRGEQLIQGNLTGRGASRFASVERRRAALADSKSSFSFTDIPATGPYGLAVKVVNFLSSDIPAGWISTKGIHSSGSSAEFEAFLNRVKPWANNADGANKKRLLLNQYARAADDGARALVVEKTEQAALRAYGKAHGLDRKLTPQEIVQYKEELGVGADRLKELTDVVYFKVAQKRKELLENIKKGGKTGFLADDGTIIPTRVLSSQLANATPMMDMKAFDRMAKEFLQNGGKLDRLGARLSSNYDVFNALWKPSVLLRFGYTVRNVTEGAMRAMVYMNSISQYMNLMGKSLAESTKDTWLKNVTNKSLIRQAQKETGFSGTYLTWADVKELQLRNLTVLRQELSSRKNALAAIERNTKGKSKTTPETKARVEQLKNDIIDKENNITTLQNAANDFDKKYNINYAIDKNRTAFIHDGIELPGYRQGEANVFAYDAASAQTRVTTELVSQNAISRININGPLESRGWGKIDPPVFDAKGNLTSELPQVGKKRVKKTTPEYFNAVHAATREFRNDEVARKILLGERPEDIVNAVKGNRQLQEDLRNSGSNLTILTVRGYVDDLKRTIDSYIPDAELRKAVATREVSVDEIRNALQGRTDLVSVHGEKFGLKDNRKFWEKYNDTAASIFRRIGALPEDAMVRHPLYRFVYEKTLAELVDRKLAAGFTKGQIEQGITNGQFRGMLDSARRTALKETQATAYTIQRYSGTTALMSYISPFFAAYSNTMRVWGRLAWENPNIVGRANLVWNAPERAGLVQRDERSGDTYVAMQLGNVLPDWLKSRIGDNTLMKFPKNSLNLIFQGEPWWSPGFGPIAQVPASLVVKNSPDINQQLTNALGFYVPARGVLDAILPMGPGENTTDIVLSSSLRRLKSIMFGTKDKDYVNQLQDIYATERQRWREGKRRDEPTFDEVRKKNDAMMALRFVSALTLPFQPKFASEYEPYVQIWKKYQTEGTVNGESATQRFYADYPDYFTLSFARSSSPTGMDVSGDAVYRAKQNRALVGELYKNNPFLIQLVTNNGQVEGSGKFDQATYVWQLKNSPVPGSKENFRGQLDPISEVKQQDVKAGWYEYMKMMSSVNAEMQKYGITSLNSSEGQAYNEMKKEAIKTIGQKYPEWAADRVSYEVGKQKETIIGINKILQDNNFLDNISDAEKPAWAIMKDYMDSRNWIVDQLQQRKANGGTSAITNPENADLQDLWDRYTSMAKANNTQFSSWYDRFLDTDKLEPIQ